MLFNGVTQNFKNNASKREEVDLLGSQWDKSRTEGTFVLVVWSPVQASTTEPDPSGLRDVRLCSCRRNRVQRVPGDIASSYIFSRVARLNAVIKHFITWPLSIGNSVSTLMDAIDGRARDTPRKRFYNKKNFSFIFSSQNRRLAIHQITRLTF